MNRAETQLALRGFFDRAACATVADAALAASYIEAIRGNLSQLEEDFAPVDAWSVEEYERVCEYDKLKVTRILNNVLAGSAGAYSPHWIETLHSG